MGFIRYFDLGGVTLGSATLAILLTPFSIKFSMGLNMPGSDNASTTKPMLSVIGKPIPNRFNCGAVLVSIPNAMLVISSAVTAGKASSKPVLKMVSPHKAIFSGFIPPPPTAIGIVIKLFATADTIIKCPSKLKNISMASKTKN